MSGYGAPKTAATATLNKQKGTSGVHTYSEEEKVAFVEWINDCLSKDPDLKHVMPISEEGDALFRAVHDGLVLCKLINDSVPGTIDERALNKHSGKGLNIYKIHENQTLAINSAASIGCSTVNIGAQDLIDGTSHLVLGLVWQIVKIGLLSKVNLKNHPELYRLLEPGETIEDLLKLPADQILLRWFNYHLRAAGHPRRVNNFSSDIKDSECYTILLYQIAPKSKGVDKTALTLTDPYKRAEKVLENADKLDCKKFVRPGDIVSGHPRLNLAFVANLFNNWPALEPVEEVIEIIEETREEKTYRNWMNSLGVDPFVNHLYDDLKDGLVLLQLFDKIQPGIVDWKRVNKPPYRMGGNIQKVENLNYCIELGHQLKFSLVGIQGKDIYDGNKTLTLGLVWQMMRCYVLTVLEKLSGGGRRISDGEIIQWVNDKLKSAGKSSSITGFKDPALANSYPIADLIDAIRPGSIDYSLLYNSKNEKDLLENARYVISVGRKIGGTIFCLPEDIVELKPKMLLTLFAALMAVGLGKA